MTFNQLYKKIIIVIRMIRIITKVIMRTSWDPMLSISKSSYRQVVPECQYCPKYFLGMYPDKIHSFMRIFAKNPTVPIHQMKQQLSPAIVLGLFIPIKMRNRFLFFFLVSTHSGKIVVLHHITGARPSKGMVNDSSESRNNIAAADPR